MTVSVKFFVMVVLGMNVQSRYIISAVTFDLSSARWCPAAADVAVAFVAKRLFPRERGRRAGGRRGGRKNWLKYLSTMSKFV